MSKFVPQIAFVGKPTDTARTATTTLALDDRLALPVIKGLVYSFEAVLLSNAHATPDIKFGVVTPTGSTGTMFNQAAPATAAALNAAVNIDGTGAPVLTVLRGTFTAGETGTFGISWAQQTSNAEAATLLAGSTLTITNV